MHLTVHFSLIMVLYWANFAVLSNFASVYLLGKGFQNTDIGLMIALSALASALSQPLIGAYADRENSPSVKRILLMLIVLFLLSTALIPFSAGFSAIMLFLAYAAALMLMQSMLALTNALGTLTVRAGKTINFGMARGIGSLGYAITSLLMGNAVTRYGIDFIPPAALLTYALFALCVLLFPFQKQPFPMKDASAQSFFKKYPRFLLILPAAVFLYANHALLNNFMFQIIRFKGGDTQSLGAAFAIAAIAELPMMFFFSRLLRCIPAGRWLVIGGIAFLLKAVGTLLALNVAGVYAVQLMQIFAYAVLTVASVYYADSVMAPQDAVKGQAYFAMTNTAGGVLGSALGGRLIDLAGVPQLLISAVAFALLGAALMWAGITRK